MQEYKKYQGFEIDENGEIVEITSREKRDKAILYEAYPEDGTKVSISKDRAVAYVTSDAISKCFLDLSKPRTKKVSLQEGTKHIKDVLFVRGLNEPSSLEIKEDEATSIQAARVINSSNGSFLEFIRQSQNANRTDETETYLYELNSDYTLGNLSKATLKNGKISLSIERQDDVYVAKEDGRRKATIEKDKIEEFLSGKGKSSKPSDEIISCIPALIGQRDIIDILDFPGLRQIHKCMSELEKAKIESRQD